MLQQRFNRVIDYWKGVAQVMAMLMATRIVEGKYDYNRVPKLIKPQVDDCLLSLGFKIVNGELVAVDEA